MACPKKKTSHRKQMQRRAKWIARIPKISLCSNCGEPSLPHIVCDLCGYYNGREYLRALHRKKRKATA